MAFGITDPWPLDKRLSMFGKWDFVREFWADPCDAPFSAYALAMGGAGLEMMVLLNTLDVSDIFWSGLQRGTGISRLRSGRKGIKGRKGTRWWVTRTAGKVASFDPNQQIGRFIGTFSPLVKKPLPGPLGVLWLIFNIFELANFFLFLMEVIAQFFYRWASLIFESKYCAAKDDAVFLGFRPSFTDAALSGEITVQITEVLKQRGPVTFFNGLFTIPPGWQGIITVDMYWRPIDPPPAATMTFRIRDANGLGILAEEGTFQDLPIGIAAGISLQVPRGGTYILTQELSAGFAACSDIRVYGQFSKVG